MPEQGWWNISINDWITLSAFIFFLSLILAIIFYFWSLVEKPRLGLRIKFPVVTFPGSRMEIVETFG